MNFLTEAFKSLDSLDESVFSTDDKDIKELSEFTDEEPTIDIIDVDAESEDDLEDSYVGQVVLECPTCKSKIFKKMEDVIIDAESNLANIGDECPYCYINDGFTIIGKIAPYAETEVSVKDKTEEDDSELEESCGKNKKNDEELKTEDDDEILTERKRRKVESFDNLKIDLDNTEISVKEKQLADDEMIIPLSTDEKLDINDNEEPEDDLGIGEETEIESDTEDIDIDEIGEDDDASDISDMMESYLKKNYDNVKSFKLSECLMDDSKMVLEGVIKFTDGKSSSTAFTFYPDTITKKNKVRFLGENRSITPKKSAFILEGTIKNKKLMVESFNYKYNAKDVDTNRIKRVSGVCCKSK